MIIPTPQPKPDYRDDAMRARYGRVCLSVPRWEACVIVAREYAVPEEYIRQLVEPRRKGKAC